MKSHSKKLLGKSYSGPLNFERFYYVFLVSVITVVIILMTQAVICSSYLSLRQPPAGRLCTGLVFPGHLYPQQPALCCQHQTGLSTWDRDRGQLVSLETMERETSDQPFQSQFAYLRPVSHAVLQTSLLGWFSTEIVCQELCFCCFPMFFKSFPALDPRKSGTKHSEPGNRGRTYLGSMITKVHFKKRIRKQYETASPFYDGPLWQQQSHALQQTFSKPLLAFYPPQHFCC